MTTFQYKAYDSSGSQIQGEINSDSLEKAQLDISAQGLHLIQIQPKAEQFSLSFLRSDRLTLDELEFITAELSLLLRSGVKIDKCLHILARGSKNSATGRLLTQLSQAVKRGESLADALGTQPDFDELYVNLVKMGEASGQLSEVFAGLARDLKFRKELKSKITQALTYPSVIFAVCVIAVIFVFNYIVPQMAGLFDENDMLPLYTELLLGASNWMQKYQWFLLAGLIASAVGIKVALDKGLLSGWLDDTLTRLPVFKTAIYQIERIRFNTSMTLMLLVVLVVLQLLVFNLVVTFS
ncbi:type II secretion system F family protein [Alkalimonas collagenimarina]|uniref:Type II secretion system F family protein n=1 Tax=Alkalimonas collagenimarina TaxID=400390 RepID=A0ABT9H0P4_9GAMM|nr:type II secretion system F family protein [Alkalimonas collagenimarina]MDP4536901.1 type II secretion system F family protein [Alkalimonas collagenimarina]